MEVEVGVSKKATVEEVKVQVLKEQHFQYNNNTTVLHALLTDVVLIFCRSPPS